MKNIFKVIALLVVVFASMSLFACKKEPSPTPDQTPTPDSDTPAGEHVCTWEVDEEVTKHSCTLDGLTKYSCSCGKLKTEITPATGHNFGEWNTVVLASCTTYGEEESKCLNCGIEEKLTVDKLDHVYSITESDTDDERVSHYSCDNCSDSFSITSSVAEEYALLAPMRLYDCDEDYYFYIYCTQDERYIRENLKIAVSKYEGTSDENCDSGSVEYNLERHGTNVWSVHPKESYAPGESYIVKRSGEVIIRETGLSELSFVIRREESNVIEVSDEIIYISSLEKKSPGYYPYTLEYSETSSTYWLTLGKVDGLNIGDIICVGEASSVDDVYANINAENTLGKIQLISYSEADGLYYILLSVPKLSEIFTKLDVNTSRLNAIGGANLISNDELGKQVKTALLGSEDFVNFLGASYATTTELLVARGASSPVKTFADFMDCIKINEENTEKPHLDNQGRIVGKVMIEGEIVIPVTITGKGGERQVGKVVISFEAYVNIDYMTLRLDIIESDGKSRFNVGCSQAITVGFTFEVVMDVDYSLVAYPYVVNKRSGVYHFESCIHVASMNEANKEYISADELFTRINEGKLDSENECGTCNPVHSIMTDSFILNLTSKTIHLPDCKHLQTVSQSELAVTGTCFGNLLMAGYKACGSCEPNSSYTNSFSTKLQDKMERGDFGYNIEEVKKVADAAKSSDSKKQILVAELPFFMGPYRIDVEIYAYVNFNLDASFVYAYESTFYNDCGFELRGEKITPYKFSSMSVNEERVNVVGSMELQVGAMGIVRGYFVGLEKVCYLSFNAEVGAYAYIAGTVRLDTVHMNDSYMAAYLECGLLCNMYGEIKLPFFKLKTVDFYSGKYPIVKAGYERVVHKFTRLPEFIFIEDIKYDLNTNELMMAGYFDLLTMKTGEAKLSPLGIDGRYTVEFSFMDGDNCFVEDGILYIIDPSKSFVDELIITVKGYDEWDNFAPNNTKMSLPEVSVPIIFDALPDMLSYDISGDHSYYIVIGKGTYPDGAMVIPSEYNGKPVTEIDGHAFSGCQTITSVVIPDSITSIGNYIFYYCENLTSIVIGDGLECISQGAFNVCTNVASISIGSNVKIIGDSAFSGCKYVKSITIPDSVVEIDDAAFSDCISLETVKVGKNVESIGRHAFTQCYELADIYLPATLKGMGDNVFYYCNSLVNIYYEGTSQQWETISKDDSVISQTEDVNIHYGCSY